MSFPNVTAEPIGAHGVPPDLSALLRGLGVAFGDKAAVTDREHGLSFAALDLAADQWSAGLRAASLGPGSHVGLLAANGPEWLAVAFGVWRAGATLVPISTFATARELRQVLVHADVDLLVATPRLRSHDYLQVLEEIGPLPRLREVVLLAPEHSRFLVASRFLRAGPLAAESQSPESIACILYTSGTTGEPKGVMLSHRAILSTIAPTAERSGLTPSDSLLSTLPLFWVAGLVIRALPTLATGCELILVPTFTADAVVDILRRHRPTGIHLRPPQVREVLAHPAFEASLLANVRRGGGRIAWYSPPLDLDDARFVTGYGMTETAGYVVALDWRDPPVERRSGFGAALPGVELRIVDQSGQTCAPGQAGEIRVRAPGLFTGYYKQPRGTGLDADGFFMTGDLGWLGAESGPLHFTGRSKDLLRVKGINVSPMEIESVLTSHPSVEAAYVVGLPPDGLEQRLVALIVAKQGLSVSEEELRAIAAAELSHYKRPECYIAIMADEVALSSTSKPRRAHLADLARARLAK